MAQTLRSLKTFAVGASLLAAMFGLVQRGQAAQTGGGSCIALTAWLAHEPNWPQIDLDDDAYEGAPANHLGTRESLNLSSLGVHDIAPAWPCFSGAYDGTRTTLAAESLGDGGTSEAILVATTRKPSAARSAKLGLIYTKYGVHLGMSLEDVMRIEGPGKTEIDKKFVILRYNDTADESAKLPAEHVLFAFKQNKLVTIAFLKLPQ